MTKSRTLTAGITLPQYVDTFTWYGVPVDQSTWGVQILDANVAPIGLSENITYDDGPKTALLITVDATLEYPVFKSCLHKKRYIAFMVGSGGISHAWQYCCGQNIHYQRVIPGYPHLTWFNFFQPYEELVKIGKLLSTDTIFSSQESIAPSFIKGKCLDDSKLLGFPDAFNVLNFILELRDVKRLPQLVSKWTKTSHDVSDKFLGTQFGLLPLASDIMSIFSRLFSNSALNKWDNMAANNKILNAHTNIPPNDLITSHPNFVKYEKGVAYIEYTNVPLHIAQADFGPIPGSGDMVVNVRQEIRCKGHVYFIPHRIDNAGELKRHLWGLDRPVEAVWNALPWSFVVDWIINIGNLIEAFERDEPLLKMRIVSAGFSTKVTTYIELNTTFNSSNTGSIICKQVDYKRTPLSSNTILSAGKFYPFRFSVPTGEQTLLGSALLHQLLK